MITSRCAFSARVMSSILHSHLSNTRCIFSSAADKFRMSEVSCATYNNTRKKYKKELHFKEKSTKETVEIYSDMTLSELSNSLGEDISEVAKMMKKVHGSVNRDGTVDKAAMINLIVMFGKRPHLIPRPAVKEKEHFEDLSPQPPAPPEECQPRAPVVTIMGHVDHGKTTLLDALRNSRIVAQEYGGITQHIGAFSVTLPANRSKVTFLDTPGHAAFKAMRERGARSTDIVVLVVAADDGVNEQTVESIKYAKEANVPIVVAINKCDKAAANPTKTRHDLMEYDVIVEDMGGDVQVVEISALKGTNLDRLQEALVFQAELMDLKATPKGLVEGVVIESTNVHGVGKACTMIVNRGTLRKNCLLVAGPVYGYVKTMHDEFNRPIDEAGPSCPVRITGWKDDLPPPGELVFESRRAKQVADHRRRKQLEEKAQMDLEIIEQKRAEHHANYKANKLVLLKKGWHRGSTIRHVESRKQAWQRWDTFDPNATPELSLILRCDVDGSLEAISNVLDTYYCEEVELNLLDFDIGPPTELNVEMAEKFNATIVCFNVNIPSKILELAEEKKVGLEHFHVIYELVSRLKDLLSAKLPPMDHFKQLGEGHVLKEFLISVKGNKRQPVAGTLIDSGVFEKGMVFRFTRPGSATQPSVVLYEGSVESLKKEKDFVERAALGAEVGIAVPDKDIRFETDDIVECFEKSLKERRIDWEPPGF